VRSDAIGEVRGLGMILGVEFRHPDTGAPFAEFAKRVRSECFARGLLCEIGGRADATLRLLPPLNLSQQQVEEGLAIITAAVAAAAALLPMRQGKSTATGPA
jgi:diaminobutyrate-2-oxoglutarate transaminase